MNKKKSTFQTGEVVRYRYSSLLAKVGDYAVFLREVIPPEKGGGYAVFEVLHQKSGRISQATTYRLCKL